MDPADRRRYTLQHSCWMVQGSSSWPLWVDRNGPLLSTRSDDDDDDEQRQANTELYLAKETLMDWPCFETWWTFCMKLLKAEWEVNQQEGEEEFKCYTIWQMMVALLHSNVQLRTERDGDTEKGCQRPALSLPEIVISAAKTDTFKRRLDKFWQHQDILYDYKVELTGVGNRSQINTDDNIVL